VPNPISVHYGKGDTGPDFVIEVSNADGSAKNISGAINPTFYVYDLTNRAMLVDASSAGVTIVGTNQLKRVLQTTDTNAEIGNAMAWFTYSLAGKIESTKAVGFLVSERWKRLMT